MTVPALRSDPTPERLLKSGGNFETGDDKQGNKVITMRDTPIERAKARDVIDERQYSALMKFKHHWVCAGLEPSYGSSDLDRIFGRDIASLSGMSKTERQVFHRQRYRQATQLIGLINSRVLEATVCEDRLFEDVGSAVLNWRHPLQARSAVVERLRDIADRLAKEWGL